MKKELKKYAELPYKTVTYFEPADNTWIAYHPELGQGSCYAIGETEGEARKLLVEEKLDFIEFLLNEGKKIPMPETADQTEDLPSGQFVARVPRTLHKKLKDRAEADNVSLNLLVTSLLSEAVEKRANHDYFSAYLKKLQKDIFLNTWSNKINEQLIEQIQSANRRSIHKEFIDFAIPTIIDRSKIEIGELNERNLKEKNTKISWDGSFRVQA